MDTASLLLFASALAVTAGSPGPSIAALTARVLTGGLGSVLPFLAAMWVGEALWLTAAVLGLAALAAQLSGIVLVLKWAGIAYLLWLAWSMWHAPAGPVGQTPGRATAQSSAWSMFGAGLTITLGNPKIVLFYSALLPNLVDVAAVGLADWLALVAVLVAVLAAIDLGWALAASRARRLLRSPRAMRIANRISASATGGAAAAIAAN